MMENNVNKNQYNYRLCEERHEKIEKEFDAVWEKLKAFENRLWAVIILQITLLVGVFGIFLKMK